ncbi:hypothetical protein QZH41_008416, partial [Actinostola sp. cb2023]
DQFDLIGGHTHSGIDFVDKVSKFVKERVQIETNYAKELRKLARTFQPKRKEEEDQKYTFHKAFIGVVKETDDLAGQHELISENLNGKVYKQLQQTHAELKNERRKHLAEAKKVQDALEQSVRALEAVKKAYERASGEAEQGFGCKATSMEKGQAAEKAKDEYRIQLDKTNNKQTLHYSTEMPAVFNELQSMEEKRIAKIGSLLTEYSDIHSNVMPIIQTCLNNMKSNAASVDGSKDSATLIEHNKTALTPPADIAFEEYGKTGATNTPSSSKKKDKVKKKTKTFGFGKSKKVEGDGNDFNQLPPGEQVRICKRNIKTFEQQVQQLKSGRVGMEKMALVYQQNPSLGDPALTEEELVANGKELDRCGMELFKYQSYLATIENTAAPLQPPSYSKSSNAQPPPAPSDNVPPAPPPAPSLLVPPVEEPEEDGEFDEERCKVLYDFEGTNDGELPVHEGDELVVTEVDTDGSGWTKVMGSNESEGYVPTAYVLMLD